MSFVARIDGDLIAYRCSASAEQETFDIARGRADILIERLLEETNSTTWDVFLTGSTNYRLEYNSEYKANRKDMVKPKWLQDIREYLVSNWGARVSDGNEADDEMAIEQLTSEEEGVIISLDKDLLQIPGNHYSWEISGTGSTGKTWIREACYQTISNVEGLRNFYKQLIMGDKTDNIFGYDGKARDKVPKFLQGVIDVLYEMTEEREMYEHVESLYSDVEIMHMNAHCLYIQKCRDDRWKVPE